MTTWSFFVEHRAEIFDTTIEHLTLVVIAMAFAILIGVPLGMFVVHRPALRRLSLGIASILQTIPSLALFGFLIPIPFIGGIGRRTAIVALVLYALLPILTATVITIGIATISAAIGAGGLGTFIFRGVAMVSDAVILAGAIPAALLAVFADLLLGLLERRLRVS